MVFAVKPFMGLRVQITFLDILDVVSISELYRIDQHEGIVSSIPYRPVLVETGGFKFSLYW